MFIKPKFYVLKLKRNIIPIMFLCFTLCLLIFSKSNLSAVKSGLSLWATSVIPSLFPFFVSTELLMHTNVVTILGSLLNKYMKPIFNIRGEGSFAFIMGIISGYPIGAKIACDFRKNNICSKEECERLLSFTNNSGPLFIVGSVGIAMFGNTTIGFLLFITHSLASLTVGIIFKFWKSNEPNSTLKHMKKFSSSSNKKTYASFSNLGEVLAESISSATSTIMMIGGFIVIFSCIISILNSSGILKLVSTLLVTTLNIPSPITNIISPFISGLLEITNGISLIANIKLRTISINILLTSFLLGCGGISILLQVWSIVSKTDLSIKPYIYGKILQAIISTIYTYVFIEVFPFFNFNL